MQAAVPPVPPLGSRPNYWLGLGAGSWMPGSAREPKAGASPLRIAGGSWRRETVAKHVRYSVVSPLLRTCPTDSADHGCGLRNRRRP